MWRSDHSTSKVRQGGPLVTRRAALALYYMLLMKQRVLFQQRLCITHDESERLGCLMVSHSYSDTYQWH